jgi:putative Mn2+ efflux pump MntP
MMNCSLNAVAGWIALAIAMLVAAIVASYLWVTAVSLFIAAALVAAVSFAVIPAIKNALIAYVQCRGNSDKCSISLGINTLGQAASVLSSVSFLLAAVMQVAALAFLYSWILSWLGVTIEAAVAKLVLAGQFSCAFVALILIGVLTNAWSFKSCMDQQGSNAGGGGNGVIQ